MKTYLIMYQLNSPGQKYDNILNYIKKYDYKKVMNSVYSIKSGYTAEIISKDINSLIDKNDWLLVMECHTNRQGWLQEEIWQFFRK